MSDVAGHEPEMAGRLVVASVLRLGSALVLDRASGPQDGGPARPLPPAVLVVPRGGGPRDPYLVVLDHRGALARDAAAWLEFVDHHVVACSGSDPDRGWNDVADVLACTGERSWAGTARRIAALLERHPGSEIVICGRGSGHVAGCRDGRLIRLVTAAARRTADPVAPWGGYGSFLHAWLTAGLPLGSLERALVVAGRYLAPGAEDPARLLVAVRAHIQLAPSMPGRSAA